MQEAVETLRDSVEAIEEGLLFGPQGVTNNVVRKLQESVHGPEGIIHFLGRLSADMGVKVDSMSEFESLSELNKDLHGSDGVNWKLVDLLDKSTNELSLFGTDGVNAKLKRLRETMHDSFHGTTGVITRLDGLQKSLRGVHDDLNGQNGVNAKLIKLHEDLIKLADIVTTGFIGQYNSDCQFKNSVAVHGSDRIYSLKNVNGKVPVYFPQTLQHFASWPIQAKQALLEFYGLPGDPSETADVRLRNFLHLTPFPRV
jgi:hypothetical protein